MEKLIEAIKTFIDLSADEVILIKSLFEEMRPEAGAYFLEQGKVCRLPLLRKGKWGAEIWKDGY